MGLTRRIRIAKEALHRAVDGELTKVETRKLKAALKTDPDTRAEFNSLKAVAEASEEVVKPVKPPKGFRRKVLKGIKPAGRGKAGK